MATSDHELVQRRYTGATRVLSVLSAAWCGISLLAIGAVMTAVFSNALRDSLLGSSQSEADLLGKLLVPVILGPLVALASGVAFGRFLLRALPPAMSDHGRRGRSLAIALYSAFVICLYVACALYFLVLMATGEAIDAKKTDRETAVMLAGNVMAGTPLVMLWAAGVIGVLIRRHRRPRAFLEQPFVLFLRRFSTFSDRAVIALILKQAPYDLPVVFLTPTLSRPADWDPYLVGFAGLKLLHPFRSGPLVIRVEDDAWQKAAEELIQRAQTILLDTSEASSALQAEAEMIARASRWQNTVCLSLSVPGKEPVGFADVHTITYSKSWTRAIPRMAIGFLFLVYVGILFFSGLSLLIGSLLGLLISLAVIAAYYYSVFVRPSINRSAKLALRTLLRTVSVPLAAPVARAPLQGIRGWLILPVIGLVITPIRAGYTLLTQYWPIFRDGTWEKLTTPGSEVYHHLWGPMLTFEVIGLVVTMLLAIGTLVLLFRKSRKTPAFAISLLILGAAFPVLDNYLANLIPAVARQSNPNWMLELMAPVISAAFWIPYFMISRRVKATFVG